MENGNQPVNPSKGYIDQCEKSRMTQIGDGGFMQFHGLTKREYFAGLAMQGMLSNGLIIDNDDWKWIAENSVKQADELLKQLEK